jgi:hypothetical protein
LEAVFEVLDIKAGIRPPAEWAIAELKEHGLPENKNYLKMGGILGLANQPGQGLMAALTKAHKKGPTD